MVGTDNGDDDLALLDGGVDSGSEILCFKILEMCKGCIFELMKVISHLTAVTARSNDGLPDTYERVMVK